MAISITRDGTGRTVVAMSFRELTEATVPNIDLRTISVSIKDILAIAAWNAAGLGEFSAAVFAIEQSGSRWVFTFQSR